MARLDTLTIEPLLHTQCNSMPLVNDGHTSKCKVPLTN